MPEPTEASKSEAGRRSRSIARALLVPGLLYFVATFMLSPAGVLSERAAAIGRWLVVAQTALVLFPLLIVAANRRRQGRVLVQLAVVAVILVLAGGTLLAVSAWLASREFWASGLERPHGVAGAAYVLAGLFVLYQLRAINRIHAAADRSPD